MSLLLLTVCVTLVATSSARIYDKCTFARQLIDLNVPMQDVATLACISENTSSFNEKFRNGVEWGLFGLHEGVWCDSSGQPLNGHCKMSCEDMTGSVENAVTCVKVVKQRYGGYNGWLGVGEDCQAKASTYLKDCPPESTSAAKGRVYDKCGLAKKLSDLDVPVEDIPTLTCIAEKISGFRDEYRDGPAWGIFGLYENVWCDKSGQPLKADCMMSCDEMARSTASAVACVQIVKRQNKGYNGWNGVGQTCQALASTYLDDCPVGCPSDKNGVFRVYDKCSLGQKMLSLDVPLEDIPILTCIAEKVSGLRNDYQTSSSWGLFGLYDEVWCDAGGKPLVSKCYVSCEELAKSTASSVACVLMLKRVQGYGAWGSLGTECVDQASSYLKDCKIGSTYRPHSKEIITWGRQYDKCSFAKKLLDLDVPQEDIPKFTCIAGESTRFYDGYHNYSAWGAFAINNGAWCDESPNPLHATCRVSCEEISRSTASSVSCARIVKQVEGYSAWGQESVTCHQKASNYLNECSPGCSKKKTVVTEPVYNKCSFAQKLLELDVPLDDIPKLTCIAEKISGFDSSYHNGFAWGIFGLYDTVWCDEAGKPLNSSCQVRCEELASSTASSVACVLMLLRVQGYIAWGEYGRSCLTSSSTYLNECVITRFGSAVPSGSSTPNSASTITISNDKKSCVVPEAPDGGSFVRFRERPGDRVSINTVLEIRCRTNYTLFGNKYMRCMDDGTWEDLPECKRKCQLLRSRTITVSCSLNDNLVDCGRLVDHGTIVTPTCKTGHVNNNLVINKCDDGWWRYAFQSCTPTCGETPGIGVGFVVNGKVAPRGLFPWHAVVYKIGGDDPSGYIQICGGTIVSNQFVVSAGHCFYDDVKKGINPPPDSYLVGLGKSKKTAGAENNNPYIQSIDVKEIIIPITYRGDSRNQQSDIALMVLDIEIEFTQFVLPICMSYDKSAERSFFSKKGSLARVPGNGLSSEGGSASEVLRYLDVPVIDRYACERELPESFQKYLTNDKICAGYLNGSSVCSGDSGGGLVFQSNVHEKTKWYLLGIVSTGVPSETFGASSCKSNTYSAFTKMSDHAEWIQQQVDRLV